MIHFKCWSFLGVFWSLLLLQKNVNARPWKLGDGHSVSLVQSGRWSAARKAGRCRRNQTSAGVSWEEIVSKLLGFEMKMISSHHWGYFVLRSDVCKSLRITRSLDTTAKPQIWAWIGFFRLVTVRGREIVWKIEKMRGHWVGKNTDIRLSPEEKGGVRKYPVLKVGRAENVLETNQRNCFLLYFKKQDCLPFKQHQVQKRNNL